MPIEGEATTQFATLHWNLAEDGVTVTTPTISMTTDKSASKQNDLLYAVTKSTRTETASEQEDKNYANGVAKLNFRHALSQIVFKAQNLNKNIYVEIQEVQVCNVNSVGTFTYKAGEVTDKNFVKHDNSTDFDAGVKGIGSWASNTLYDATTDDFGPKAVQQDGEAVVDLTDNVDTDVDADPSTRNYKHSLLLIPQTADAWVPGTGGLPDATEQTGAYFKVRCKIWNVAAGDGSIDKDVVLWDNVKSDNTTAQYIYVPVKVAWEVGKKYIYTIKFTSDGHGGYTEEGKDVLIPITFSVTVDDFAKGADQTGDVDGGIAPVVTPAP